MTATTPTFSKYQLQWDQTTQWNNFPELGSIYSQEVVIYAIGNVTFIVSFQVSDVSSRLGFLFAEVKMIDENKNQTEMHYCFGQFHTNLGAMKFAQFALNHFIEWENWSVCPNFTPIEWINGDPIDLAGNEICIEEIIVTDY